jgi:hypothetical protein
MDGSSIESFTRKGCILDFNMLTKFLYSDVSKGKIMFGFLYAMMPPEG